MGNQSEPYQSDQIEGTTHPSQTEKIYGHSHSQKEFINAYCSKRLHHGWLISGPAGIGKATLTWKFVKLLLSMDEKHLISCNFDDNSFDINRVSLDRNHALEKRIAAGSEPRILVLRRIFDPKAKNLKKFITVDQVRQLNSFFHLSCPYGKIRIVIIDCVEDLNANAANAILKTLEEPPSNSFFFLISHNANSISSTIRSRCRQLKLKSLNISDFEKALGALEINTENHDKQLLFTLSKGSVGAAIKLINMSGIARYKKIINILKELPKLNHQELSEFANQFSGKTSSKDYTNFIWLFELVLNRIALFGVGLDQKHLSNINFEYETFKKLSPNLECARIWAYMSHDISQRLRKGYVVNIDLSALILDAFFRIEHQSAKMMN